METFLVLASTLCISMGVFLGITGAIGIFRMPNFFARLHAASVTDSGCAFMLLFGLMLQSGFTLATIKLCFILLFFLISSPTAAHALAKTALSCGAQPTSSPREER
ncbi:MAG: monovalent cation/H(+) antiporter subunit G [Desulfuromonadaceae bacterium]|jgi:multicomponent Na+:H+ antiporter subunit G|nr:monovalent cation/H(+) antiporter subunit G [Desulfuromonas sp.]MDY0185457.1 monovalent cation/H(+) antiporter subunit G [Desulfuromonadaceae bacterium]